MKRTQNSTIKLNHRVMPFLVGLLLLMQIAYPYRGWIILLVALGGAWLVGHVWARALSQNLRLRREMRFGWAHVGDRLEERFTLTNSSLLPAIWVEIADHTTMPDYDSSRVTGVDGRSHNRWHTQGICRRRGIFTLGPTSLHTGDPFGLYTVTIHSHQSSTLTVTPPVVPLPTIEVAPGGQVGEGRSRPSLFERTVSTNGVREYAPGDSLSWVHWPTTARRQSLFVRLFDSTPSGDWWIFLDLDERMQLGQGYNSTEEHSVILAASLADRGLRANRPVGLVAHGDSLIWLPPQGHDGQRQQIMQALAQVTPGNRSLAELLAWAAGPQTAKISSLIIITANTGGNWLAGLLPLVQQGTIPTVLLLDPASFGSGDGANQAQGTLAQLGITHYIISRDLLDRPEARPGRQGRWAWQVSPSGRAIATRRPGDLSWKALK